MGAEDHTGMRYLIALDSGANYLLGLPMLVVPRRTATVLGIPEERSTFYQRVLGGVLTGVATALAIEHRRSSEEEPVGLGAGGAIAINAVGGGAVALWLAASPEAAALPRRGRALLWGVASGVLAIGAIEAWREAHQGRHVAAACPPTPSARAGGRGFDGGRRSRRCESAPSLRVRSCAVPFPMRPGAGSAELA